MPYEKTITINVSGNTKKDMNDAIDEAVKRIQDGNHSGMDSNDDSSFSFDSEMNVVEMKPGDISDQAKSIAASLTEALGLAEGDISGLNALCDDLQAYSMGETETRLEGYCEETSLTLPSMIQILINEQGGVDNDGHIDVADGLVSYWADQFDIDISEIKQNISNGPKLA